LRVLRVVAISPPQLLVLLDVGARFDLLLGFNRTDYGFSILVFLFVVAPLITLSWLVAEIILSLRNARRSKRPISFLMPGVALLFFAESVLVDIFLLSQARM